MSLAPRAVASPPSVLRVRSCRCRAQPAAATARAADLAAEVETRYLALQAKAFASAPELTVAELQAAQAAGEHVVLCDVRTEEEMAVSVLPGALARADVEAQASLLSSSGALVVTYCTLGVRSGVACSSLLGLGLRVVNLRGGILAYTHAQGILVEPSGAVTKRVHTYSQAWALQHPSFEAVVFRRQPLLKGLLSMARDKLRGLLRRR